ncbi:MAG TPA: cytidine deaminase [Candidatus Baltobacteraceae bacterium]|jgi:cytidine deaminase|nr:cytidine deaminase [Candidatus Baltobacteraceae bacterium]
MPFKDVDAALTAAHAYRAQAYAPYSNFAVGAVVVGEDGTFFGGANVENASYGLTICAERAAVFHAVASGRRDLRAVAIAGPPERASAPCGACRQVLREFNPGMDVAYTASGAVVQTTLERLLPDSFGPEDLR